MKAIALPTFFLWLLLLVAPAGIGAQPVAPDPPEKPAATVDLNKAANTSTPLQIVVMLTLLSFIPALLISMTCFTRLIVVFHFLRQALGTQEAPNNQILLGLALF